MAQVHPTQAGPSLGPEGGPEGGPGRLPVSPVSEAEPPQPLRLQVNSVSGTVRTIEELVSHYQEQIENDVDSDEEVIVPAKVRSVVISKKNLDGTVTPVASKPIHEIRSLADPIFNAIPKEQRRLIMTQFGVTNLPDREPPLEDAPVTLSKKNEDGSLSVLGSKMISQIRALDDPFFQDIPLSERHQILAKLGVTPQTTGSLKSTRYTQPTPKSLNIPKGFSSFGRPIYEQTHGPMSRGAENGTKRTKEKKMKYILQKLRRTRSKLESDVDVISCLKGRISDLELELSSLRGKVRFGPGTETVADREQKLRGAVSTVNNKTMTSRKTQTRIRDFKAQLDGDLDFSDDEHETRRWNVVPVPLASMPGSKSGPTKYQSTSKLMSNQTKAKGLALEDLADFELPSNIVIFEEEDDPMGKGLTKDPHQPRPPLNKLSYLIKPPEPKPTLPDKIVPEVPEMVVPEMVLPPPPPTFKFMVNAPNVIQTTMVDGQIITAIPMDNLSQSGNTVTTVGGVPMTTVGMSLYETASIQTPKPDMMEQDFVAGQVTTTVVETTVGGLVGKMEVIEDAVEHILARDMPTTEFFTQ